MQSFQGLEHLRDGMLEPCQGLGALSFPGMIDATLCSCPNERCY